MYSASKIARQQYRYFSISRSNNSVLDYFKFFKKKNNNDNEKQLQPKDTNEVIKEVQENQDNIPINEKIEILGRKNPRYTDKEIIKENLNGFQIHRWIPKSNSTIEKINSNIENYQIEILNKLNEIFDNLKIPKDNSNIDDLFIRFNIFKTIQKTFLLSIPDSNFTHLKNFNDFNNYLITNLNPKIKFSNKSEFQPDAVDLDSSLFNGTNVSIGKWTFQNEKQKAYKNLLKKASKLEKQSVKQFENSSNNSIESPAN